MNPFGPSKTLILYEVLNLTPMVKGFVPVTGLFEKPISP